MTFYGDHHDWLGKNFVHPAPDRKYRHRTLFTNGRRATTVIQAGLTTEFPVSSELSNKPPRIGRHTTTCEYQCTSHTRLTYSIDTMARIHLAHCLQALILLLKIMSFYEHFMDPNRDVLCMATPITVAITPMTSTVPAVCINDHLNRGQAFLRPTGLKPGYTPITAALCTLLLGGDIDLNPGPKASSIFLCGYGECAVNWSNRAICCDYCSIWFHKTCADVCSQEYERLEKAGDSTIWTCYRCNHNNTCLWLSHRNLSSCIFNSFHLDVSNVYEPLADQSHVSSIASPDSVFLPPRHSSPLLAKQNSRDHLPPKNLSRSRATSRSSSLTPDVHLNGPRNLPSNVSSHCSTRISQPSSQSTKQDHTEDFLQSKKNNWRTLIVNCNGAAGKRAELAHLFETTQLGAVIFCETKLNPNIKCAEFIPPGSTASVKTVHQAEEAVSWPQSNLTIQLRTSKSKLTAK